MQALGKKKMKKKNQQWKKLKSTNKSSKNKKKELKMEKNEIWATNVSWK